MKVLVIGAGAIGVYVGGSLAQAGHTVAYLARPAAAERLRAHGLRLGLETGPVALPAPVVYTTAAEALAAEADMLVFALKAFDTAAALADLRAAGRQPPPSLCLQNGVDNEAELAAVFGAGRVIAGTVTTAVSRGAPGEITVERKRGVGVALGHPLSRDLIAALDAAGLNARGYASAPALKWSKLLTNLVGSATAAILDLPVGAIYADPRLFRLEQAMLREALAVMRAVGAAVVDLPGTPVRALALGARLPAALAQPLLRRGVGAGRGAKPPSLHLDLHGGRGQTEVAWLHGAVARHGAKPGVPAPINQRLCEIVSDLSAGRRELAEFRQRPEALLQLING